VTLKLTIKPEDISERRPALEALMFCAIQVSIIHIELWKCGIE
jgi:hypothetical protein